MTLGEYRRYRSTSLAHIRMLRDFIGRRHFGYLSAASSLRNARENLTAIRTAFYCELETS